MPSCGGVLPPQSPPVFGVQKKCSSGDAVNTNTTVATGLASSMAAVVAASSGAAASTTSATLGGPSAATLTAAAAAASVVVVVPATTTTTANSVGSQNASDATHTLNQ